MGDTVFKGVEIVGTSEQSFSHAIEVAVKRARSTLRELSWFVFEGEPCKVLDARHHTPGNLRAMMQTKLRKLRTGSSFEHRFRSADTVERAVLEQHEMEFMYADGTHYHFMNTENYEQTALSDDDLG